MQTTAEFIRKDRDVARITGSRTPSTPAAQCGRPQLAIGVAALDTRNTAVDASPDVYGIVHDLPEVMTSAPRRAVASVVSCEGR
jgi:hypothetical protein